VVLAAFICVTCADPQAAGKGAAAAVDKAQAKVQPQPRQPVAISDGSEEAALHAAFEVDKKAAAQAAEAGDKAQPQPWESEELSHKEVNELMKEEKEAEKIAKKQDKPEKPTKKSKTGKPWKDLTQEEKKQLKAKQRADKEKKNAAAGPSVKN